MRRDNLAAPTTGAKAPAPPPTDDAAAEDSLADEDEAALESQPVAIAGDGPNDAASQDSDDEVAPEDEITEAADAPRELLHDFATNVDADEDSAPLKRAPKPAATAPKSASPPRKTNTQLRADVEQEEEEAIEEAEALDAETESAESANVDKIERTEAPQPRSKQMPATSRAKSARNSSPQVVRRETPRTVARGKAQTDSTLVDAAASPANVEAASTATKSAAAAEGSLLFSKQSPQLRLELQGPRTAIVDRLVEYRLSVRNDGAVSGRDVRISISVPPSAEMQSANASGGEATLETPRRAMWTLSDISARGEHQLTLGIVSREDAPLDLEIGCESAPLTATAKIEVQQPLLDLIISGPDEVECGTRQRFRLTVKNPGNGPAENATLTLQPIEAGEQPATHKLGRIEAGAVKTIDIELVARQAGTLEVDVRAEADGVEARSVKSVIATQAQLETTIKAPKSQFTGAPVAVEIKVSNSGNAPARRVRVSARLPKGASLMQTSPQHRAISGGIEWELSELAPAEQATLQIKYSVAESGEATLVTAAEAGNLKAEASATTTIQAVADLVLELTDPQGPVGVGDEASYKIRIRNRGTSAAESIDVSVFFDEGVEPIGVDGAEAVIDGGAAVVSGLGPIAAGSEKTLTVKAKGSKAGNHRCRVELTTESDDIRLGQEESTLFFESDEAGAGAEPAKKSADKPAAAPATPKAAKKTAARKKK